jgi:U4/U6 small nuclear ribonucleoprotein PRP4
LKFFRSSSEIEYTSLDAAIDSTDIVDTPRTNGHGNGKGMEVDTTDAPAAPSIEGWGANRNSNAELPRSGLFLVTAGFDCNVRIWSADEWSLIRNLATDAGKVMSVDVTGDGKFIASASYSRSFHLFGGDSSL